MLVKIITGSHHAQIHPCQDMYTYTRIQEHKYTHAGDVYVHKYTSYLDPTLVHKYRFIHCAYTPQHE
jgi:hypothetical protein